MQILTGLFDHAVLQRTPRNVCDALITGTTGLRGVVVASVKAGNTPLRGYTAKRCGQATGGKFSARLQGLPAGGPYAITLSVTDKTAGTEDAVVVRDVLVGDVWVLAGQSNAEGCGLLAHRAKPHPQARAFYMDDHWGVAEDPVNRLADSVDQVHADLSGGTKPGRNNVVGVGPAVAFIQECQRVTGVPQGVIASAHGGTSMMQWDPAKKKEGSKSLYGATIRRITKNGGKVAGIIWYQGESDCNAADAPLYTPRMKKLVAAFRRDTGNMALPFVLVQLSRVVAARTSDHRWWELVREAQRLLPVQIKNLAAVPAIDLSLDDNIHISGRDQQVLGRRMAQAALALTRHPAGKAPIALKKVTVRPRTARGGEIEVEFANVSGQLEAGGAPLGFYLLDEQGTQYLFDTRLEGPRAVICTCLQAADIADRVLFYGAGTNPTCTIRDSAGRSLPAFGPVHLGKPRAVTAFPTVLEVSALQPSAGRLHNLAYPADLTALSMARRSFTERFTHVRSDFLARQPEDVLVFFRCPFECAQPMRLEVLLGYDGPVKMWLDGQEKWFDAEGINPAIVDHRRIAFTATAGVHEILVALSSNHGKAWGIFLRLERSDVPLRLISKGPGAYVMPQFVLS